ncbi:DNA-binding MarR family transcriptional regulator [Thermosporothrix hazakensis]|uniref:DNA-binding MarR family transcriptional regulator n=2 Tax=Thermosporothrix TaxID=768650 RepID=A0A326UD19_THEHA|nr:MarR family transcriptional regulator [Thermosporothrix hazakensis]PZW34405.1 DNA-binding MarR family transcriptional regulator [Thermosporothrix hazakensis]BBH85528.1 transcriptional regulator [Thermosporothrix sp. COM3]GCE46045.1 transcriptional regulator [Thermosporothrix hazakensis]
MDDSLSPTAQKLLQAFSQFSKEAWKKHYSAVGQYKPSEVRILYLLKGCEEHGHAEGMRVSDISKLLLVTPPTVTQVLKGLEQDELIERHTNPKDRRATFIRLTEKGHSIIQRAFDSFSDVFQGLIEYLGEDQSNQLAELLTKAFLYLEKGHRNGEEEKI